MSTIKINNNTPQPQCSNYVVISGGAKIKYNDDAIENTGESIYGYGWVNGDNSIASFGFTDCTGIITKHDNGKVTLAHVFPSGYSQEQVNQYKTWLTDVVKGNIQGMWLVGGKNSQNASNYNGYKPDGYTNDLTYIGPQRNILNNFRGLDILCTSTQITVRCRPRTYSQWSEGFTTEGAVFNENFKNSNGSMFDGKIKMKTL